MGWVRIDDGIADHVKVLRAGPAAAFMWVCAIAYCNRKLTDGFVPAEQVDRLTSERGPAGTRLARRCVEVGLFDDAEGGYAVHDYLAMYPTRAKVEDNKARAAERKAAERERRAGQSQRDSSTPREGVADMSQRDIAVTPLGRDADNPATPFPPGSTPTPTPTPTPSSLRSEGEGPRPALARPFDGGAHPAKRRTLAAWESAVGLDVPERLHDEFAGRLRNAGIENVDEALREWYAVTERAWSGRMVGEDCWRF